MSYNEAGARTKIISPRLYQVGLSEDSITYEYNFTQGESIFSWFAKRV